MMEGGEGRKDGKVGKEGRTEGRKEGRMEVQVLRCSGESEYHRKRKNGGVNSKAW
jgi:hypothetical protein